MNKIFKNFIVFVFANSVVTLLSKQALAEEINVSLMSKEYFLYKFESLDLDENSIDELMRYETKNYYGAKNEFEKRKLYDEKIDLVHKKIDDSRDNNVAGIFEAELSEYDFEKKAFPIYGDYSTSSSGKYTLNIYKTHEEVKINNLFYPAYFYMEPEKAKSLVEKIGTRADVKIFIKGKITGKSESENLKKELEMDADMVVLMVDEKGVAYIENLKPYEPEPIPVEEDKNEKMVESHPELKELDDWLRNLKKSNEYFSEYSIGPVCIATEYLNTASDTREISEKMIENSYRFIHPIYSEYHLLILYCKE